MALSPALKEIVESLKNSQTNNTQNHEAPAFLKSSTLFNQLWRKSDVECPVMVLALPKHVRKNMNELVNTSFTPVVSYERGMDSPIIKLALTSKKLRLAIPAEQLTGSTISGNSCELDLALSQGLIIMMVVDDTLWISHHVFWNTQWAMSLYSARQMLKMHGAEVKAEGERMKESIAPGKFECSESIKLPLNFQFESNLLTL